MDHNCVSVCQNELELLVKEVVQIEGTPHNTSLNITKYKHTHTFLISFVVATLISTTVSSAVCSVQCHLCAVCLSVSVCIVQSSKLCPY